MLCGEPWIVSMDLNALPHPEDDEEIFGQQLEDEPEEFIVKHSHEHADYVASAVEISRRVRLCLYYLLYHYWAVLLLELGSLLFFFFLLFVWYLSLFCWCFFSSCLQQSNNQFKAF